MTPSPNPGMTVLPVIHYRDDTLAIANAALAFELGCAGVFLISMEGDDEPLNPLAVEMRKRWPDRLIGVNHLSLPAEESLERNIADGLSMTWADRSGVTAAEVAGEAIRMSLLLEEHRGHLLFGSVAFKGQRPEPNPPLAAQRAASLGMVPTTSGPATGHAPTVDKIRGMREALPAGTPLAIASGLTPENVAAFLPLATHALVATGVSSDFHVFSRDKLARFCAACRVGAKS